MRCRLPPLESMNCISMGQKDTARERYPFSDTELNLPTGGLNPDGEMLKGPEKEASFHEACPAEVKTRCFHCLLQQLRFWSFLLSSVSWQSLLSQFFLKSGLTLLVHIVEMS